MVAERQRAVRSGCGQVVVRFWTRAIRCRSGSAREGRPTPPGDRRRRADRRTSDMSTRISNAARGTPGGLVDIVSGSFGAGHDAAAFAIAHRLHARGFRTRTWDVVDLMPGRLGRAV